MLNAEGVQKIIDVAKFEVKEINGVQYYVGSDGAQMLMLPRVTETHLFSLKQIVNFAADLAQKSSEKFTINVRSFDEVEIYSQSVAGPKVRDCHANSDISETFKTFPFGSKMTQEDFIIQLMTKFVQDDVTKELIKLVSTFKKDSEVKLDDDGFSQKATVKSGVALVKEASIKNLWVLKTYKTFPEIEQPSIPYILRLHDSSSGPLFALYDCDGGAWKVDATARAREFIVNSLKPMLGEKFEQVNVL